MIPIITQRSTHSIVIFAVFHSRLCLNFQPLHNSIIRQVNIECDTFQFFIIAKNNKVGSVSSFVGIGCPSARWGNKSTERHNRNVHFLLFGKQAKSEALKSDTISSRHDFRRIAQECLRTKTMQQSVGMASSLNPIVNNRNELRANIKKKTNF